MLIIATRVSQTLVNAIPPPPSFPERLSTTACFLIPLLYRPLLPAAPLPRRKSRFVQPVFGSLTTYCVHARYPSIHRASCIVERRAQPG